MRHPPEDLPGGQGTPERHEVKGEGPSENKTLGARGEEIALAFLKKHSYRIVETNYRCKCGEIDIIARDRAVLVFVEVKTRRTASYGPPQLSVTPFKQRQISKAALTWLAKNRLMDSCARFDVVGVFLREGLPVIEHIENAFDLAY
ncbi:MAG: YraN family protein [Deltaproteobacteria bacterium]|nr:YraN family protein [Deltaproteobacteria bacterium]